MVLVQMEHLSINPQDIEYPPVAIAGLAMDSTDPKQKQQKLIILFDFSFLMLNLIL